MRRQRLATNCTLLLLLFCSTSLAFYLPGVAPHDYSDHEKVDIKVNKLTSYKTQVPIDYYDLGICKPAVPELTDPENLGEVLTGNRIEKTSFEVKMAENNTCAVLCHEKLDVGAMTDLTHFIDDSYSVNMIVDNLPGAVRLEGSVDGPMTFYEAGFRVGFRQTPEAADQPVRYFVNNHLGFVLHYHEDAAVFDGKRIVRFEIVPDSVNHQWTPAGPWTDGKSDKNMPTCSKETGYDKRGNFQELLRGCADDVSPCPIEAGAKKDAAKDPAPEPENEGGRLVCPSTAVGQAAKTAAACVPKSLVASFKSDIIFTYDVKWEPSEVKWASRWDIYLNMDNRFSDEVHWFSIINSLLIVFFLTGIVAMIMMRTLHRDLARYNRVPTEEEKAEEREESGWKLVHGDVFRPPTWRPMLFAVFVGNGVQVFGMSIFTMVFAALGFLSPANRGSMMIALLVLFVLMGAVAGYWSARTFKMFNGKQWQKCTCLTSTLYPGLCCAVFFVLDLFLWANKSVAAIPFGSMVAVFALWFIVAVPLTFFGAYLGYRRDVEPFPVVTHAIPRQIPEQPWYMGSVLSICVGGVLPFGVVFVELFFIISSIWLDQYYYVFGFLLLVFIILVVSCAEISVVLVYFQLCGEDYNWWWRSALNSGSSAFYLFAYSAYYFFTKVRQEEIYAWAGERNCGA
eukprot:g2743.t1